MQKSGNIIKSIIVAMTTVKPLNNGERYLNCYPHTCYSIVGLNTYFKFCYIKF